MAEMRDIIQHINEDKSKLFPGADDEELANRMSDKQKARRQKEIAWERKNDRKIDHCPSCETNLRVEGVTFREKVTYETPIEFNDGTGTWVSGSREEDYGNDDYEYFCFYCGDELERGEDFDVSL